MFVVATRVHHVFPIKQALLLYLWSVCLVLLPRIALGIEIQLNYSDGFQHRIDAVAAMEVAAATWESMLSDPVTIEIDVREATVFELGFGVAGAAFPRWYEERYPLIRSALLADATSPDDALATAHLQPGPQMRFQTWDAQQNVVINEGDDWINNWSLLPRANLKALGLPIEEGDTDPDAEILWGDFFLDQVFDFERIDGIEGADFISTAIHEIGHALGFLSGADDYDIVFAGVSLVTPEEINDLPVLRPLDLFRYSTGSVPLPDLTPGVDAYFSIDGGITNLGNFATGEFFGDGWQPGHWQFDSDQGIMEAFLSDNAIHNLSPLDLRAMDVIGWDLVDPTKFDFDGDGVLDVDDADQLVRAIVADSADVQFDLTGDAVVDHADLTRWLAVAARENDLIAPYVLGDADLDGAVDVSDLNALAQNWLGTPNAWQFGDFNADGIVNAGDLNKLGQNWLSSIPMAAPKQVVPEPSGWNLLTICLACIVIRRR